MGRSNGLFLRVEETRSCPCAEGTEPRGGEGEAQAENIPWSVDWKEREEVRSRPQVGGWTDQKE